MKIIKWLLFAFLAFFVLGFFLLDDSGKYSKNGGALTHNLEVTTAFDEAISVGLITPRCSKRDVLVNTHTWSQWNYETKETAANYFYRYCSDDKYITKVRDMNSGKLLATNSIWGGFTIEG